jgi:hypothetical protein
MTLVGVASFNYPILMTSATAASFKLIKPGALS